MYIAMTDTYQNWKTQIRKGYMEMCLLLLIERNKKIYGLELLEKLENLGMPIKEGTLYPILNRLTSDDILTSYWETENIKGHPRKFYSLTKAGTKLLTQIREEYEQMFNIYHMILKEK